MRRTLTTFILLFVILVSAFYMSKIESPKKQPKLNLDPPNINLQLLEQYNMNKDEIEKYRIGVPINGYNNPNKPYSNPYPLHPKEFIPGYRQPIDAIVPGDYTPTLDKSNEMFCTSCMDKTKDYYVDLLNLK